jgi:predicted anti-sigma-YlaC factor YlaD
MHRLIREHLEELLADPLSASRPEQGPVSEHLAACDECRSELTTMRQQSGILRQWRVEEEVEPRAGFYARVLERIEAQTPASIWSLFFDSVLGRRIAVAALTLAVLVGVTLVSLERIAEPEIASSDDPMEMLAQPVSSFQAAEDQPGVMLSGAHDDDSVLVDLVTYSYREQ